MADHDYINYPALKQYINRLEAALGAEATQTNFKTISLRSGTREGYYRQLATVTISNDATIKCWPKEYAPTEQEAEGINKELKDVVAKWPRSTPATIVGAETHQSKLGVSREDWFQCLTADRKMVVWVQERRYNDHTGKKEYKPWAFFSDGEWRQMEPDEGPSFWKPNAATNCSMLMIHEGPKAARAADRIANHPDSTHPWREELASYEHWGLMSGAAAPERMDWQEVRRAGFDEVVYVCDNDTPGGEALIKVSEAYRGRMYGVKFNDEFPPAWDMADPIPKKFYNEKGLYIGPSLDDLMVPGTWGAELLYTGEKGRPVTYLRDDFKRQWKCAVEQGVFINERWPDRVYSKDQFNALAVAFTRLANTAVKLLEYEHGRVESLAYVPAQKSGTLTINGRRVFNTHKPSPIRSLAGDASPWLDFLEKLIPHPDDRHKLMKWIATLIARPDLRMGYAVLLFSEMQGTGKSTLAWILTKQVGPRNYSTPSESVITNPQYNDFAAEKRLIVCHEIYAGSSNSAYNRLKNLITEDELLVSKKYAVGYQIDNWAHILVCSNSSSPLKLSVDDRRWFVPRVTEEKKEKSYWTTLYDWLNGDGLGIIRHWAERFVQDRDNVVKPGEEAPASSAKATMVKEGFTPSERLVDDWLHTERDNGGVVVTTDLALRDLVREIIHGGRYDDKLLKPATIRKVARNAGFYISEKTTPAGEHRNAYIISNDPEIVKKTWGKVKEAQATGADIKMVSERIASDFRQKMAM